MLSDIIATSGQKSQPGDASNSGQGARRQTRHWRWGILIVAILAGAWLLLRQPKLGGDERFVGIWQITGFGPAGTITVARFQRDGTVVVESVVDLKPRFRQSIPWTWRVSEGNLVLHFDTPRFGNPLQQLWTELKLKVRRVEMSATIPLRIRSADDDEVQLERIEKRSTMPEVVLRRLTSEEAEELLQSRMTAPYPVAPVEEDESR